MFDPGLSYADSVVSQLSPLTLLLIYHVMRFAEGKKVTPITFQLGTYNERDKEIQMFPKGGR